MLIMRKNYYDELIKKIKDLIEIKKNNEALNLINEELSMPYVPKIYEQKLYDLLSIVNPEKANEKKIYFSRDELLIMFENYKDFDNDFLLNISSYFEEFNWKGHEDKIEKILINKNIDNKIKSIIYNNLALQNIDYDFKVENYKINPHKNKTIFETDFAFRNFFNLENEDFKNPSIKSISKKIFVIYLMNTFPDSLFFDFENINKEIINISKFMIGENKILNSKEKKIYEKINNKI